VPTVVRPVSRFHLAALVDPTGPDPWRCEQADTERQASDIGRMLAGQGYVVLLAAHEHDGDTPGAYRQIGMFIDDRYLPCRPDAGAYVGEGGRWVRIR